MATRIRLGAARTGLSAPPRVTDYQAARSGRALRVLVQHHRQHHQPDLLIHSTADLATIAIERRSNGFERQWLGATRTAVSNPLRTSAAKQLLPSPPQRR